MRKVELSSLDLGVIGNCSVAALVDRKARIVWSCFPRLDADPVFCALLDNDGAGREAADGTFSIELEGDGLTRCVEAFHSWLGRRKVDQRGPVEPRTSTFWASKGNAPDGVAC